MTIQVVIRAVQGSCRDVCDADADAAPFSRSLSFPARLGLEWPCAAVSTLPIWCCSPFGYESCPRIYLDSYDDKIPVWIVSTRASRTHHRACGSRRKYEMTSSAWERALRFERAQGHLLYYANTAMYLEEERGQVTELEWKMGLTRIEREYAPERPFFFPRVQDKTLQVFQVF